LYIFNIITHFILSLYKYALYKYIYISIFNDIDNIDNKSSMFKICKLFFLLSMDYFLKMMYDVFSFYDDNFKKKNFLY